MKHVISLERSTPKPEFSLEFSPRLPAARVSERASVRECVREFRSIVRVVTCRVVSMTFSQKKRDSVW